MPHTIPLRLNLAITGAIGVYHAGVLFLLPRMLPYSLWWGVLLIPAAFLNVTHWGLIHEAIHKLLHPNPRANDSMGRGLGILMGASFSVLRFGHLMHHKLNRGWHSERVREITVGARLHYYAHLLFGLYVSEVWTSLLLTFLPRRIFMRMANATFLRDYPSVSVAGERFFYERGNIRAVRTDVVLAIFLYGCAFAAYGTYFPVLLGFFALRALVISFLDNIYHYATPADNSKAGKELTLPGAISAALLHNNYHETHHLNPQVPWRTLPKIHAVHGRAFDGALLQHGLMQFEGPVV